MPRVRDIHYARDETLFPFKSDLSIKAMVGFGILVGSIVSEYLPFHGVGIVLGSLMILPTIARIALTACGLYTDPLTKMVLPGRKHGSIEGDFVVFLIGARAHKHTDSFFKWQGDAMTAMQDELEANPDLGCLGVENYAGPLGAISIQYWRSEQHLTNYSRSLLTKHVGPWLKLAKKGRECADYGFWHETYRVRAGEYETIYVNCPPMLLGNCRDVKLVDAIGKLATSTGRMGISDGNDLPDHLKEEAFANQNGGKKNS